MTNQVQLVICVRPLERALTGKPEYFRVFSEVTRQRRSMHRVPLELPLAFPSRASLDSETQQTELFDATTRPVIDAAFNGNKNGLVVAYGVTNAGKTYTISGTTEAPGILPQSLEYIMNELFRQKEIEAQPVTRVTATYLEIYDDNAYDLFSPPLRRKALRVQDCDGHV
ncbi:hypothetical protein PsorP6_010072 [Peronosclerospora sorghi]|uniref:Uncharacterized protein n=1 Tax=Peronosclerospora sorghi TaxID=230839 RepID=A0ACC0VU70_9STRA|nr:hypothetical protein PsorP6_010072 [Peronosclerospora sorghi]